MKIIVAALIFVFLGGSGFAQSRSVLIEDLTGQEVQAAVTAGKTTLIYHGGATHADGPVIAVGKHLVVAHYVAQRVAEELGNALVLPINPYAPASPQMMQSPTGPSGSVRAGTISLSEETYGLVTKEVVNSAVIAAGFKNVIIMGDHGPQQDTLKRVARDLDGEWKSKGVRVYFIPIHAEAAAFFRDYLTKQNVPPHYADRTVLANRQVMIDDDAELLSISGDKWVRLDALPPDDRKIVSRELGKIFVDFKVRKAVELIRSAIAK